MYQIVTILLCLYYRQTLPLRKLVGEYAQIRYTCKENSELDLKCLIKYDIPMINRNYRQLKASLCEFTPFPDPKYPVGTTEHV